MSIKHKIVSFLLFLMLSLSGVPAYSQLFDSGDIASVISNLVSNMPGESGDDYTEPSPAQRDTWADVLEELFQADYPAAAAFANQIDYDLTIYDDQPSGETYYLLTSNNNNYWGTYVFNPSYCRELVIQAPHPRKDFNTARQGIHVFRESESLFFAMAGTHRCNHSDTTMCSGLTEVCGEDDPARYRISDLAHTTESLFQRTTQELYSEFNNSYFLSLHGFTKKNSDPYVILSNGTRQTPNPDYISILATELDNIDPILSSEIAHVNQNWDRLIGFTNTQGRLINGSNDHCSSNANTTDGRFLHIEQEKTELRANIGGWDKMAEAVINTFPCSLLPVSWERFQVSENQQQHAICEWETASEQLNAYFAIERSSPEGQWITIGEVAAKTDTEQGATYQYIDERPLPGQSYYRIRQVDVDHTESYSPIASLQREQPIKKLYPNPSRGVFQIELNTVTGAPVRLFNSIGKEVSAQVKINLQGNTRMSVDASNLPAGWYWIVIDTQRERILKF